ncbi:MAG: molecular chaperone TorD family protein [Desulforhopalus sp.]
MKQSVVAQNQSNWYAPHAYIRTDSYVLLAALLTDTPSENVIELVQNLGWGEDLPERMNQALAALNHAGTSCSLNTIAEEYHRLFVGLGHGELLPYGSWYLEKMIQSTPLAAIRKDLTRQGIVRQTDSYEPEDHAGALCEIMALLSYPGNEISDHEQAAFFNQHLSTWMPQFFMDLQTVKKSQFYRVVGEFGRCFIEGEIEYLQYLSCVDKLVLPEISDG